MKMRRFEALFLVILSLFSTTSCKKASPIYQDALPAAELAEEARDELDLTDFRTASNDWLADYATLPEGLSDYEICFSSDGSNLDEFGIYHVSEGQIAATEAALRTYLSESLRKNREFYDSYIPEQTQKLEKAEVRVFGNYVCYAILDEQDKSIFFGAIQTFVFMLLTTVFISGKLPEEE